MASWALCVVLRFQGMISYLGHCGGQVTLKKIDTLYIGAETADSLLLSSLLTLLIALPLYVCATASVPIAAALVSAGMPLGSALIFLMAGPATNAATIGTINRTFGLKRTIIYLITIIVGSVGGAFLFEMIWGET